MSSLLSELRTKPNLITLSRVLVTPLVFLLIKDYYYFAALLLCIMASLSDFADGYYARTMKLESDLGRFLDAMADKIFIVVTFLALSLSTLSPWYLFVLVVLRDLIITGCFFYITYKKKDVVLKPSLQSKVCAALQLTTITWILLNSAFYQFLHDIIVLEKYFYNSILLAPYLIGLTALATIYSGFHYLFRELKRFKDLPDKVEKPENTDNGDTRPESSNSLKKNIK